jgi:hypothetical protein
MSPFILSEHQKHQSVSITIPYPLFFRGGCSYRDGRGGGYSRRVTSYERRTGATKTTDPTNHVITPAGFTDGIFSFKTINGRTSSLSSLLSPSPPNP